MDDNPELVQPEDWVTPGSVATSVPLFLIHDGGGNTFAYHCLKPLNRIVYGIFNPHFWSGEPFEGGIPEMGRLYCSYIRKAIANPDFPTKANADGSVNILLGGWSLGGLLSLEVARQLSDDSSIRVIGLLMIDSIHPHEAPADVKVAPPDYSTEGKSSNQILAQNAMRDARRMVPFWKMPVWDEKHVRPPAILLRAKGRVPQKEGIDRVDVDRDEHDLAWSLYEKDMFVDVLPVEGHHFELFSFAKVDGTGDAMRKALDRLEMAALMKD